MIKRLGGRGALYCHLETLFGQGTSVGSTEGELLDRFVIGRDGAAFEALVARHGPMVLGVCRQLLRDPNDVDDAFQATFLVLVRKAPTLRRRDLLGNWLYGVAYRVAARARSQAARNFARITTDDPAVGSVDLAKCREQDESVTATLLADDDGPLLHKELSVLPEKYRVPIVLCYFEGLTHDEAASRLGWPLGTVKGRISRARDLLRRRLTSRGMALSSTALAAQLAGFEAKAAVPGSLQISTLRSAQALAYHLSSSLGTSSVGSLSACALAQGVLNTMVASQVKTVAFSLLLVAGTVATGVGVAAARLSDGPLGGEPGNQAGAASTAAPMPQPGAPAGQAHVRTNDKDKSSSAPMLVEHLASEMSTFRQLLARFASNLEIDDIHRLYNWSYKTLEADETLATTDADRVAAHAAHRNRIKKLVELTVTEENPVSNQKQAVNDLAVTLLVQAETGLKDISQNAAQTQSAARMGMMGMMKMMGGRPPAGGSMAGKSGGAGGGMMGGMTTSGVKAGAMGSGGAGGGMMGRMMAGGSKTGAMGSGGAGRGMMGRMMAGGSKTGAMGSGGASGGAMPGSIAKGAAPANRSANPGSSEKPQSGPNKAVAAKDQTPNNATTQPSQETGATGGRGQKTAGGMGGGMRGMGGGMRGMGGGMGGMGGGMGGMGGMMGNMMSDRFLRSSIAVSAAELASHETNPQSKAILKKLDARIDMSFNGSNTLEEVLNYIKQTTATEDYAGIPIYVDPKGLKEAEASLQSPVELELSGVPLKTTFRLMLKQIGLAYCVRDGVLIVSSVQGIAEELQEAMSELQGADPQGGGAGGSGGGGFGGGMGGMM